MQRFEKGDHVRIDIPDQSDPDHDAFHGKHGIVTAVLDDNAAATTGDERDSLLYRVQLDNGQEMDFRWLDLRPP